MSVSFGLNVGRPSRRDLALTAALVCVAVFGWTKADAAGGLSVSETWDVAYLSGKKIGYAHTVVDRVEAGGQTVFHITQTMNLVVQRFGDETPMQQTVHSFELADGRLYAVESRTTMGAQKMRTRGRLDDAGKFQIDVTSDRTERQTIDWSDDVLGPYAAERLLREKPLAAAEERSFKMFMPDVNQVAVVRLKEAGREETEFLGGAPRSLRRVEQTTDLLPVAASLWIDDAGTVVKMRMPLGELPLVLQRGTRADAVDRPLEGGVDLGVGTLVKLQGPTEGLHEAAAVVYKLTLTDAGAAALPATAYQKVLSQDGGVVRLQVERRRPPTDARRELTADERTKLADYLAPNGFIQSDDPSMTAAAKEHAGADDLSPWERVERLEKWVDGAMTNRDFSVGFADALTVLSTRQGDCTEHAVLLTALCRSAGIPARTAMGLVYLEGSGSMGYHMWTEAYVGGEWYAVDGTMGRGGAGPGHIKLADGSLKGTAAISTFLPIFQFMGKVKIAVEDRRPARVEK
ncbi:MAG: transglutaminase-like domain-containing protein [Planctomycetia bacterium]